MALNDTLRDLLHRADEGLISGWYKAISLSPDRVHRQIRAAGHNIDDLSDREQRTRAAHWVIDQVRFRATVLGGLAGLGGLASVPPEAIAHTVGVLRMGQRLGIIYGFDPHTDRGQMALWQALAAGYEVKLSERGPVGMRVSDLPSIVAPAVVAPRTVGSSLIGEIIRKSAWTLGARVSRVVPVASAGVAAVYSRRHMQQVGHRMHAVFQKLGAIRGVIGVIEDAEEVPSDS
ncbi:MAG: EcsC family protein [Rhodobacterales bacterium]|nr:EcsC family protein [Rhodobacterales bacterium]